LTRIAVLFTRPYLFVIIDPCSARRAGVQNFLYPFGGFFNYWPFMTDLWFSVKIKGNINNPCNIFGSSSQLVEIQDQKQGIQRNGKMRQGINDTKIKDC